ncbi:hypothetical protein ACHAQJ_004203 [Trichoderma viride]
MALHFNSRSIGDVAYQSPEDKGFSRDKAQARNASAKEVRIGDGANKPLQFVTVTSTSTKEKNRKDVSKVVRTQAMRDYFWKQRNPESNDQAASDLPTDPSRYKGRFRLNSPPNSAKAKAGAKKEKVRSKKSNEVARAQKGRITMPRGPITDLRVYDPDGFFATTHPSMLGATFDPFDAFNMDMKPAALKLIYYYKQSYVKDFLEINIGGGYCLFDVRENCALFHAILYLVALDYTLRRGFEDDLGCLYHSSEAFRLINEQIRSGNIKDSTIAAVALMSTKENLAGMFDISYIHMQGLKDMVQKRGGIDNIEGLHRGVVMWADFCNSTVFNCEPQFPHSSIPLIEDVDFSPGAEPRDSPLETILSDELPVLLIIQSLRDVSAEKELYGSMRQKNRQASNRIYDIEYKLHCLQRDNIHHGTSCGKMIPLCVALNIYLYLAVRELPVRSKMIMMLIDRLKTTFNTEPLQWWVSNQQQKNRTLWMLFIGYGAATECFKQAWFIETIKSTCDKFKVRDLDQLEENLKDVIWLDSWCDHYFEKLRADLKSLN